MCAMSVELNRGNILVNVRVCGSWNSLVEQVVEPANTKTRPGRRRSKYPNQRVSHV